MTTAPYAELGETHTAVVVMLGDRAFKIKKPVDLGFLDLSTLNQPDRNDESVVVLVAARLAGTESGWPSATVIETTGSHAASLGDASEALSSPPPIQIEARIG